MAKRFTDTEKWSRPWFRNLPQAYKLLWLYILDQCDIAGVWYVDMKLANFKLDVRMNEAMAKMHLGKQIEILDDGRRWLIRDFIAFQYGKSLSGSNRLHTAVISTLEKHGVSNEKTKPLGRGLQAPKDKDINTVLKKEGDSLFGEPEHRKPPPFKPPSLDDVTAYCTERKNAVDPEKWLNHYESNGWRVGRNPMKDWKAAVRTWEKSGFNDKGGSAAEGDDWRIAKPTAKR